MPRVLSIMAHSRPSLFRPPKAHDAVSGAGRHFVRSWPTWLGVLGVLVVVVAALIAIVDGGKNFLGPQDFAVITTRGDSQSQR